jgi:NADPH:quinone reductase-like Zn-dependent oxidoreductase
MATIRAVVVDADAPAHLKLGQVDEPVPLPGEALVRVKAISLNRGETRAAQNAKQGARPGWDFAGTVEQMAPDGSGPLQGQRVVGMLRTGAWAELVAVPTTNIAVLPDNVTFEQASTIPVAGLTALYALDRGDGLVERNVLVTGASGGVGNYAIQIARYGGATVTGLARQEKHLASIVEAGAHHAVADESGMAAKEHGPYNLVLESVGGQVMGNVLGMLAPQGQVVSYGVSGGGEMTIDSTAFRRGSISTLLVFTEQHRETAAVGLARLARLISKDILKPLIGVEAPWEEIGNVAQQLLDRAYPGKAVLTIN